MRALRALPIDEQVGFQPQSPWIRFGSIMYANKLSKEIGPCSMQHLSRARTRHDYRMHHAEAGRRRSAKSGGQPPRSGCAVLYSESPQMQPVRNLYCSCMRSKYGGAGACVALLLALAGCGGGGSEAAATPSTSTSSTATAPATVDVSGTIELHGYDNFENINGQDCDGIGLDTSGSLDLADLRKQTQQIVVADASGKTIAIGKVKAIGQIRGSGSGRYCWWSFTVDGIPAKSDFYTFKVGQRGASKQFTRDDLNMPITLKPPMPDA